jgi:phospholipid transport system substrate-binding protein
MKMRRSVALAAFCLTLAAPGYAADDIAPDALARSVTDDVLSIVRTNRDLHSTDVRTLLELVEAKVLPHFDFARMTQLAVGRNWREATPEQQDALTGEFRALLVRTYTTAFLQYRDHTVDYRPLKMAPGDVRVVVRSLIRQAGGPPVSIDYNMERTTGAWKVYDVKIEGVSLVETYRGTFNAEVQRGGIDGLIRTLTERNRFLSERAPTRR